jgi:hypothetical protein
VRKITPAGSLLVATSQKRARICVHKMAPTSTMSVTMIVSLLLRALG